MKPLWCGHDREALMADGTCDACADNARYGCSYDEELHAQYAADAGVKRGRWMQGDDDRARDEREQRW